MKPWLSLASIACFALVAGCDKDPEFPDFPDNPEPNTPVETIVPERDGLPDHGNAERLLYYVSTQEDGPGLYAYQPSNPDAGPQYIDPELNVVNPFHHAIHRGTFASSGAVTDFHVGGVFYRSYHTTDRPGFEDWGDNAFGLSYLVSTEPSQLQSAPSQITDDDTGASFASAMGGLFSFDLSDLSQSSFLTYGLDSPIRYDFDQGADDPVLALPEGRALASFTDEGSSLHEHWLYINEDDELVFFNRDFSASTAVVDEDTDTPIDDIFELSTMVTALNTSDYLVILAKKTQDSSDEMMGPLYRVSRPSDEYPGGSAKILRNADGEANEFAVGMMVLGRGAPSAAQLYTSDGVAYFSNGPGMFSQVWSTFTRATRDSWSAFSHKKAREDAGQSGGMPLLVSRLPAVFFEVPGHGTFWAPGGKPELIEPTAADGQSWTRTALDVPEPVATTIFNSVNGWIYYDYSANRNGAVAYHVPTKQTLSFRNATWVGASSNGDSKSIGNIVQAEISEVFLLLKDRRLVAFEAANPDKGMVVLGTLPSTADDLNLFGLGRGPHRLFQLTHDDDSAEVLYVDTRSKGSLKSLMSTPATDWERGENEDDVRHENTRPVMLF